jgi:hypothetical protein
MTKKPAAPLLRSSFGDLPRPGERTIAERYEDLITTLKTVDERRAKENIAPLDAAHMALKIVLGFLKEHSDDSKSVVSRALLDLALNLEHQINGSRAPMFRSRNRSAGGPTVPTRGLLRARIVIAIEMLCHAGMKDTEAASYVIRGLNRRGIAKFEPKQIKRWCSDKETQTISGYKESYDVFIKNYPKSKWPLNLTAAKRRVAHWIEGLEGLSALSD